MPEHNASRELFTTTLPPFRELADTPFVSQEVFQCGPAALAMLLGAKGVKVPTEVLVDEVYVPKRFGSFQIEMVAAARSRGFVALSLKGGIHSVLLEIAAGNPVLVLQNAGWSWLPVWHYAVVIGYDLPKNHVILRSGTTERLQMPMEEFEATWSDANRWGLVILTPEEAPVTASALDYLGAVRDLETTGNALGAIRGYQTALDKWPENEAAAIALGNAYHAVQDFQNAERAFENAVLRHPGMASAWNNRAWALQALGCTNEAVTSARCALALEPTDHNVQSSVVEMEQRASSQTSHRAIQQCPLVQCPHTLTSSPGAGY